MLPSVMMKLGQADEGPEPHADEDRQRRGDAHLGDEDRDSHAAEGRDSADRQVDARSEDHERHPDRDDPVDR
jgi:hypothetical protein